MVRHLMPACALLAALALLGPAGVTAPTAAADPPRVQSVADPRGDQTSSGPIPATARRSIDVRRLFVARDAGQLRVVFEVADVRSFGGYQQRASVVLRGSGLAPQTYTTAGSRLLKTSRRGEGLCGGVVRRPGADTVTMRMPFSCIRTKPGRLLELHGRFSVAPSNPTRSGRADDRTRVVRVEAR